MSNNKKQQPKLTQLASYGEHSKLYYCPKHEVEIFWELLVPEKEPVISIDGTYVISEYPFCIKCINA